MALKAGTVRLCATKSRTERHPLASAWLQSLLVVFGAAVFGAVFFGAVVFGVVVFGAVVFVVVVFGAVVFGEVVFGEVELERGFFANYLLWRRGHINLR